VAKDNSSVTSSMPVAAPLIIWAIVYTALWALLSRNQGWLIGLIFITAATAVSYLTKVPDPRIRLHYLPAFSVFFLSKLLSGGIDVALRTFSAAPLTSAGWVRYPLRTRDERVRLLLSALMGLLPGTLAARMDFDELLIHALDTEMDWLADIARLEWHLQRLAGRESSL
jgi:multicomponent Na+:H+ antiporter subunit E